MCYWLITESGQIISKSSVQHVIKDDFLNPNVKETIEKFNKKLVERLSDSNHRVDLPEGAEGTEKYRLPDVPLPDELEYDGRDERNIPKDDEYGDMLVDERPIYCLMKLKITERMVLLLLSKMLMFIEVTSNTGSQLQKAGKY
jgi:hypothetical protein